MADDEAYEVEQILDKRKTRGHLEYKVRWKNYGSDDDTWEPVENVRDAIDLVDIFNEKLLLKQGLIQPIRIKIKSTKNKQYSSGTLLTLKNPISPRHFQAPIPIIAQESPSLGKPIPNMGKQMEGDSKRTNRVRKLSMSETTDKLAKLARQLSYDDYMHKYNKKQKKNKRLQRVSISQWAQMSPTSKTRLMASPPGSPMTPKGDHSLKHKKKLKHKNANFKRKRLPDSPDSPDVSDLESEETILYPLGSGLKFIAGTSTSEPRTTYGRNGTPAKKMKRSYSAVQSSGIIATEDGEISFPKKRNASLSMEGEGELGLTTPQSTPPSTPNGSQSHLEHASHKVPSIMTPMMRSKSPSAKVISPTGSIKAKAFYSPPVKVLPQRAAGSVARRRLSQMSMSSEDEDEPDRRFSMRVTENIFKYKEVVVKKSQGYTQVWLFTNSPSRNAVGVKALQELNSVLENAAKDETKAVVLCGSGSIFCSGLDLRLLATQSYDERKKTAKALSEAVRTFVDTLISFPKLLVAAVNGPAIGFGAAILPLCDIVYASDKAYFHLPYSSIGMTPEGCSSFTYPHYLGLALASEMLFGGRKLTALEACTGGIVSQVLWPTTFMQEVIPRVQSMVTGSLKGLMLTKSLVRSHLRAKLEYTNESECAVLKERWGSSECFKLVKSYVDKGYD